MLYVLEKHGSLDGSNLVTWGYDSKGLLGKSGMYGCEHSVECVHK